MNSSSQGNLDVTSVRPSVRTYVRPYARIRAGDEFAGAGNPRFFGGKSRPRSVCRSVLINFLTKKIQNDCISVCLKINREGKTFYSNLVMSMSTNERVVNSSSRSQGSSELRREKARENRRNYKEQRVNEQERARQRRQRTSEEKREKEQERARKNRQKSSEEQREKEQERAWQNRQKSSEEQRSIIQNTVRTYMSVVLE